MEDQTKVSYSTYEPQVTEEPLVEGPFQVHLDISLPQSLSSTWHKAKQIGTSSRLE